MAEHEHLLTASIVLEGIGSDQADEIARKIEELIDNEIVGFSIQELSVSQLATKSFYPGMSIAQAKDLLGEKLAHGDTEECPVCERVAKVYKRTIHKTMALHLIQIYNEFGREWCRPIDLVGAGGDIIKTRWWDLMEGKDGRREDGSDRVGVWRITKRGEQFVLGRLKIRKHAHVYDNRVLKISGPEIDIRDALGNGFNYNELMNS